MPDSISQPSSRRRWLLQVAIILLAFGLLAWAVWLYYDYEVSLLHHPEEIKISKP